MGSFNRQKGQCLRRLASSPIFSSVFHHLYDLNQVPLHPVLSFLSFVMLQGYFGVSLTFGEDKYANGCEVTLCY